MRSIIAAVTLLATSAYALSNADFNPVNFLDEEVAASPLNETFSTFRWKGDEAYARESFELNSDAAMRIQVTDYKNRGDMFEVFDNGVSLGLTTKVDDMKDSDVFAATPEEALMDDRFSKGVFDLASGAHKITIKAVGPYEAGTAAIRVLDHTNNAFYKKGGSHHDDDDDEGGKHWHKDDDDDEDDGKDWHKDDDDEDDDDDKKHWHKDGDDDEDDEGGKHWHKGGDDDDEGGKHWNKGGDDDSEGGKHWHKGGEGDEGHGGSGGGKKWGGNKKPTTDEIDLDHTITFTKTQWVHVKPTQSVEEGGHHWGNKGHGGGYHKYDKGGDHHKGDYHKGGHYKGDGDKECDDEE